MDHGSSKTPLEKNWCVSVMQARKLTIAQHQYCSVWLHVQYSSDRFRAELMCRKYRTILECVVNTELFCFYTEDNH